MLSIIGNSNIHEPISVVVNSPRGIAAVFAGPKRDHLTKRTLTIVKVSPVRATPMAAIGHQHIQIPVSIQIIDFNGGC